MNIYIIVLYLITSFNLQTQESFISNKLHITDKQNTQSAVCPPQNDVNESIVEDFITKPSWSSQRTETNAVNLTLSQITLLNDSNYSSVCTTFNSTYQEAFDEENGLGDPAYNVTYYKAGSFYFVVITIRQPDDTDYATSGVSYLTVYNQNLSEVGAYAF